MRIFVRSSSGKWLMPTTPAKARVMLKQNMAKAIRLTPFTIQLLYDTTEYIQRIKVGIDDGGKTVGIAAVCQGKTLLQQELTLRTDIKSNLDTRRQYRRSRRNRKTRYRKARFENRGHSIPVCKVCGGNAPKSKVLCRACLDRANGSHQTYAQIRKTTFRIPPSSRAKKDAIVQTIKRLPLPVGEIVLEDAYFDFQALDNPEITGEQYQFGELFYHRNYKQACLFRDGHKCRVCGRDNDLCCHHVVPRSKGGTGRLSNLMTLCRNCHNRHHREGLRLPKQKSRFYVFAAHVQQGKNYLRQELDKIAPLTTTFGYITSFHRNAAGIEKNHANDALVIADPCTLPSMNVIKLRHVRSRKRNLHEATARKGRKQPNRNQRRNRKNVFTVKGFHRWDTVLYRGRKGFISGFAGPSSCRIIDIDGKSIKDPGKSYIQVNLSEVQLIHRNQNYIADDFPRY
jgi:hypothetical protein